MKKMILAAFVLVGLSSAGFAQTTASTKKNDAAKVQVVKKTASTKPPVKTVSVNSNLAKTTTPAVAKTPAATKPVKTMPVKAQANSAATVKKDGTPDMRYKVNKDAAKNTAHLKKDGTPDMRYRASKKHS